MTQGTEEKILQHATQETAVKNAPSRTETIGEIGGSAIRVQLSAEQAAYLRSLVCSDEFPDVETAASHVMRIGFAVYSAAREIRDPDLYD